MAITKRAKEVLEGRHPGKFALLMQHPKDQPGSKLLIHIEAKAKKQTVRRMLKLTRKQLKREWYEYTEYLEDFDDFLFEDTWNAWKKLETEEIAVNLVDYIFNERFFFSEGHALEWLIERGHVKDDLSLVKGFV